MLRHPLVFVLAVLLLASCATSSTAPPTATQPPSPVAHTATPAATAPLPAPTSTPAPAAATETSLAARPQADATLGDTWVRPADGMVMVYVPAGEFLMGSAGDALAVDHEKPQRSVYLDAFWIDQTEVTNAHYRACVEAGMCRTPGCWENSDTNAPQQPVVCVTWDDAQTYAHWVGGRLPTEAEWEKAARGWDGRIYPWGDHAPTCDLANYLDCVGHPDPVGSCPAGISPVGALDMAGNVWEWVSDWYASDAYSRSAAANPQGPETGRNVVVRGGTWKDIAAMTRCAARSFNPPDYAYHDVGFRVVMAGE